MSKDAREIARKALLEYYQKRHPEVAKKDEGGKIFEICFVEDNPLIPTIAEALTSFANAKAKRVKEEVVKAVRNISFSSKFEVNKIQANSIAEAIEQINLEGL